MGAGKALDDKTKEKIKALLSVGKAKNAVAKEVGVSWATVDKVSKEDPDEIEDLREQKRIQFIDRLWDSMDKALGLADKRIKLALDETDKLNQLTEAIIDGDLTPKQATELSAAIANISTVPLSHISTYIGTIYDKHALMTGGKTADVGLTFEDQLRGLIGK